MKAWQDEVARVRKAVILRKVFIAAVKVDV
jgi:hypothetical protein